LLTSGYVVLFVVRSWSYSVRDCFAARVFAGLEGGNIRRETVRGEKVERAPHCPGLDEGPLVPESIFDVLEGNVLDSGPKGESGTR